MSKNERKTEDIVRDHFKKNLAEIILEEQTSDSPKISKLLSTASKSGLGGGFPEFIIQYKNNPDFLIVIECKAEISKHESANRDKYKDYSVDGVLLYSSYLSKDFDVLSIAISGESKTNIKISHFLQLKGEKQAVKIFGNDLLNPQDYLHGYIKSPEKFKQDYEKLLTFSKELNDTLHGYKIVESDRGLLISCILIALENKAFEKSYKDYSDPRQLADYLVTTVKNEFQSSNIGDKKVTILASRFEFIKTDTSLSTEENVLRSIIIDINDNIKDFIKTHEYFDVLGQLYIEFLRYANSDKGLGIVLTPPHITEFMSELAEVNKNSRVYDNCTGTGGFLVSAMNLMIKDAKGDLDTIKSIKKEQLVGVEYQAHIFALACSNMFIHQDGKSNILKGSCFDKEIIKEVKQFKPTVGLLNPPYKSDKKKDIDEYEFVLNNLDCLEQGGKCVAIIPMQSALAQTGKVYEYKNKILEQHTLEAVFSMPDELFFNSKVGVVSCIMVFTAKRPHPKNKKVYFGYYKNDGFVKRKNKGRVDLYHKFEKQIKETWINTYMNREEIPGFSVTKMVTAKDEWCAEAYMETDYSTIEKDNFSASLTAYMAFLLSSKKIQDVIYKPQTIKKLEIETHKWANYNLNDLFNIRGSKTTPLLELEEYGHGEYPFVTTQATNNGVEGFYNYQTEKGNVLVIDSAVLGYCSYQPFDFSASDHVEKLIPKFDMDKYIALFLATILNKEQYRYNYGRKASQTRLKERYIKLPTNGTGPDWDFMRNYVKSLPYSSNL
jgi:type I restriction-modification system DNA methylase subunit